MAVSPRTAAAGGGSHHQRLALVALLVAPKISDQSRYLGNRRENPSAMGMTTVLPAHEESNFPKICFEELCEALASILDR